jgi:hypothetical protein
MDCALLASTCPTSDRRHTPGYEKGHSGLGERELRLAFDACERGFDDSHPRLKGVSLMFEQLHRMQHRIEARTGRKIHRVSSP